jgi:predicted nucleic acid-binding protein
MKFIFADTFFFLALVNRRDTHHHRAVEESQRLNYVC